MLKFLAALQNGLQNASFKGYPEVREQKKDNTSLATLMHLTLILRTVAAQRGQSLDWVGTDERTKEKKLTRIGPQEQDGTYLKWSPVRNCEGVDTRP